MRSIAFTPLLATVFAALLAAPPAYAQAPDPALLGAWSFEVPVGATTTRGRFLLQPQPAGRMAGALSTNQGDEVLIISTVEQTGARLRVVVGSPNGDVVFTGDLAADRRSFEGEVTYHTGQRFPMRGRKDG